MGLPSNPLVSHALPAPDGYYLDRSLQVKKDSLSASERAQWGIDAENEIKPLQLPYGAVLDSIAAALPGRSWAVDTTSELLSARAQVDEQRGGKLNLSAGIYTITGKLNVPSRTILQGAGMGKTILRAAFTGSHFLELDAVEYVVLRDMTIDAANQYLITSIAKWARNIVFERVEFANSARLGCKFEHSRNVMIRFCESHDMAEHHGFSCKEFFGTGQPSASDLAEGNGKPGTFWSQDIAVYSNYVYNCGDNGYDFHTTNMEMAGNEARNCKYASKQPDTKNTYLHHNAFIGGEYGTRAYWSYTNGDRDQDEVMAHYYDNIYVGVTARNPHVHEKTSNPAPVTYSAYNFYVGSRTPPIYVNGATCYTDMDTAPERTISGMVAAPSALQAKIATLRSRTAFETEITPPDASDPGAPVAYSTYITGLEFASDASIRRVANGSANWPLTWASDDALYGGAGDGTPPSGGSELSLWFARVDGGPANFTAARVTSAQEQTGPGANGLKMSGILAIGSTLYAWIRNRDKNGAQSALWFSTDDAATWQEAFVFAPFGYLAFVQFGKAYAGARDNYVYAISPDTPSAYTPADAFILLRVPKEEITNKSSYEVFSGFVGGNPTFHKDFAFRQPIFTHAGQCLRHGISYVSGINRYLWWQGLVDAEEDERYFGGFGIYEAAQPWGPWSTVFFTTQWDVGPGETANFPAKWISGDGKTVYLSFSGEDALSVRKMTLTVENAEPAPPDENTWTARIGLSENDAEEDGSGVITVFSGDLDMGEATAVALYFPGLEIPRGKTIRRAVIRFTASASKGAPVNLAIGAHDVVDAPEIDTGAYGITALPLTPLVQWPNVRTWDANKVYETPDLASIVQRITNTPGWTNDQAITFVIVAGIGNPGGVRSAKSFDNDLTQAPELFVEWDDGAAPTTPTEMELVEDGETYATIVVSALGVNDVALVERSDAYATIMAVASDTEISVVPGVLLAAAIVEES